MQISKGVEWAAHACGILCAVPQGKGLQSDAIAEFLGVPPAYMAKQMQLLRKASIVDSVRGQGGGYRLAQTADQITLWDIMAAIDGSKPSFRCTEIRQNGPCPASKSSCKTPCIIAAKFAQAETAFRQSLAQTTLAEIAVSASMGSSVERMEKMATWLQSKI
jgi:Rrf2 family protein